MSELKFIKGGNVRVIKVTDYEAKFHHIKEGDEGVLLFKYNIDWYVRMDKFNEKLHDAGGRCEKGHGWMFNKNQLELIEGEEKPTSSSLIAKECDSVKELLLAKNKAYGNSALEPSNIFSKLDSVESIKVRIDDKLKRIQNKGFNDNTEDTLQDLIGYFILLRIALKTKEK